MDQVADIIRIMRTYPKESLVKVYLRANKPIHFHDVFYIGELNYFLYDDCMKILPILEQNKEKIISIRLEWVNRNSAVPLLDYANVNARIEPGAHIREHVTILEDAVILMGAVINIGACIGRRTMIDMNAVIGSRAIIKNDCHIGAGAVLAGVLEPVSSQPVIVENNVMIGANAVILEGVRIGHHSVIGAGAIVTKDVLPYTVIVGNPGRKLKDVEEDLQQRTALNEGLR